MVYSKLLTGLINYNRYTKVISDIIHIFKITFPPMIKLKNSIVLNVKYGGDFCGIRENCWTNSYNNLVEICMHNQWLEGDLPKI